MVPIVFFFLMPTNCLVNLPPETDLSLACTRVHVQYTYLQRVSTSYWRTQDRTSGMANETMFE